MLLVLVVAPLEGHVGLQVHVALGLGVPVVAQAPHREQHSGGVGDVPVLDLPAEVVLVGHAHRVVVRSLKEGQFRGLGGASGSCRAKWGEPLTMVQAGAHVFAGSSPPRCTR